MQPVRKYRGIVIGATGAVGIQLVIELLKSEKWEKVLTLTRRNYELPKDCGVNSEEMMKSGKLENKIVDFENIDKEKEVFQGYDYMFSCFGTTRKDAGGAAPFMHIDHDYNVNAAKLAKEAGIQHYGLLSAMNAKETSYFTYPRCKGLIEKDIKQLDFDTLSIFRPGILNRGDMARWNEKLALWMMPSIPVAVVAKAMRIQAELDLDQKEKQEVVLVDKDMKKMAVLNVCRT